MHTASQLIQALELEPHPEGGHYREVYRSTSRVVEAEPGRAPSKRERSSITSIYYLLQAGEVSRWHVVASDEIWHFYEGDQLELLTFAPGASQVNVSVLGSPSSGGQAVAVVPAGVWQAARAIGTHSLVGCSVGPGFEFEDFEFVTDLVERDSLATPGGPMEPYLDLL